VTEKIVSRNATAVSITQRPLSSIVRVVSGVATARTLATRFCNSAGSGSDAAGSAETSLGDSISTNAAPESLWTKAKKNRT
jgi:hypothetical protein